MAPRSSNAPRCLIVDDHPVVRAGVRAVLESAWKNAEIVESSTLDDAAGALDSPDVVVVDPWRVGVDVSEIVAQMRDTLKAPVVVFTSDGGARLLSEALKAGVKG